MTRESSIAYSYLKQKQVLWARRNKAWMPFEGGQLIVFSRGEVVFSGP
jgi:hypothetical protein